MSIIRKAKKKDRPFTVIENSTLEDDRLTWEAKGLLCHLLGKPDDWTVRLNDLQKRSPDRKTRVSRAIKCLYECGYVERIKAKSKSGKMIGTEYVVHESPVPPRHEKTECRENAMSEPPRCEKTDPRENRGSQKPTVGKTAPLVNNNSVENNNSLESNNSVENNKGVVPCAADDLWHGVFPDRIPKSETEKKQIKVQRTNKAMQDIGECLKRKTSTLWSVYEAQALKRLSPLDREEVDMVKAFYAAPVPKDGRDSRRHCLETLLNNWNGEVDKARKWLSARQSEPTTHRQSAVSDTGDTF